MSILTHRIAEPLLEFGHGQQMEAPKDGLFLFGPLEGPDGRSQVRLGVIGTESGVGLSRRWLERISLHIPGKVCQSASKKDPLSACKRDPLRRAA